MMFAFSADSSHVIVMDINGYFSSFPEYVYLGFSLPLLLFFAVRNRHRAGHDFSKWIHFYGHSVVWITSLTLFMVQLFEIAEGIMQEQLQPGIEPSLYIPDVLAVFSTVLSLVIFNYGEHHSSILWPCLSLLYWLASSIVDLWQLINCISLNGSFNQSQPLLNLATLVLKTSLFGLYAFLIIYQVSVITVLNLVCVHSGLNLFFIAEMVSVKRVTGSQTELIPTQSDLHPAPRVFAVQSNLVMVDPIPPTWLQKSPDHQGSGFPTRGQIMLIFQSAFWMDMLKIAWKSSNPLFSVCTVRPR